MLNAIAYRYIKRAVPCSAAATESTIDRPATPTITPRMSSVLGLKARP